MRAKLACDIKTTFCSLITTGPELGRGAAEDLNHLIRQVCRPAPLCVLRLP
jgi:hypothetical protein